MEKYDKFHYYIYRSLSRGNSFDSSYEVKDNEVITRGETYLSSDGLLSCDNCNTNISYVYPVIVIKDIILKSGTGTKKDPYIFK